LISSPFNDGYYTEEDLQGMGFKSVGKNVQIAKNNTIVGVENISIKDNVRIDGYCAIIAAGGGWVEIGSHVHIGGWCYLSAGEGIRLSDFSGLSQGVKVYTRSDDYSGEFLTNPTVPEEYVKVSRGSVILKKHVVVGSGSVILPGLTIEEGSSVGALSLVTKNLAPWGVYFGSPVKRLKSRSQRVLELEKDLFNSKET